MNQLIIFRALQGIGGSAIYSAVIVTLTTMVPVVSLFNAHLKFIF
jgi:MFS family permease